MNGDFKQQARAMLMSNPERILTLWQQTGRSLIMCQMAEEMIATYIAIVLKSPAAADRAEAEQLLADELKLPLGRSVHGLKKLARLDPGTSALLDEFVAERNWLAHRLQRENGHDLFHPDRFGELVKRVSEVGDRAEHVQAEFGRIAEAWTLSRDVTADEIDAEAMARLRRWVEG